MSTALEVVLVSLAVALPCPVCGSTAACACQRPEDYSPTTERANLIVAALAEHGHLPRPEHKPGMAELSDAARYLGARSLFIRYEDDGWRKLLQSPTDVTVAWTKAQATVTSGELDTLASARDMLLRAHTEGVLP